MGKCVCITGGTKGIGRAVAACLAEAGYDLLLTYAADSDTAQAVASELSQRYAGTVHLLQADITSMQSVDAIHAFLTEHSLRLEAIVFNAGITCRAPFGEIEPEDWQRVFFANVHFPVFLLQRVAGLLNEGGSVVFTGSLMGIQPHSVSLAYGVSKAAVHALVKNLVKFMQPYGVRVNAVAPGFVDTDWQKQKPADVRRRIEGKIAQSRFCAPEELAGIYKMLIENAYFNGEVIVADGGYSYE